MGLSASRSSPRTTVESLKSITTCHVENTVKASQTFAKMSIAAFA
jgi:hypothetical protein